MPRRNLIRSNFFPYHVTHRCNNREWFKLPMQTVWRLTTDELYRISILYGVRVHAFVLMSNHYHLLLSTPEADLGKVMADFGTSLTRTFNLNSGRSGHLFGGRYKWSIIQTSAYYANALKYVYRNPIRAKVVDRVQNYPYSSLQGLLGEKHLPFPIYAPDPAHFALLPVNESILGLTDWLNIPLPNEDLVARALKKRVFKLPMDEKVHKKSEGGLPLVPRQATTQKVAGHLF